MVNLVENWEVFAKYAKDKVGFFQTIGIDKNVEVRVQAGKAGYIHEFETATDPVLERILDFCKKEGFLQVGDTVRDEVFFK